MCAISPLDVSVFDVPAALLGRSDGDCSASSSNRRTSLASTVALPLHASASPNEINRPFSGRRVRPAANSTPFLMKKKWSAHAPQPARGAEPDETMLIVASLHFMDQSKPAAEENDRLAAAAELLGRGRGRGLRDWRRWPHRRAATGVIAARKLRASLS